MTWSRDEEEVDRMIADMVARSKGKYITQGVSFNKTCPRQMGLLKKALMTSISFSGLAKELLAVKFDLVNGRQSHGVWDSNNLNTPKNKNTGNFI